MKAYKVTLKSTSPISFGKRHQTPKLEKEHDAAYDERTWPEKMHIDDKGNVIIPPMMVKNSLAEAAKFGGTQIPGKGKATYTKHVEAGVLVTDPIVLPLKKEDVKSETHFVPSDGQRGSGKRVDRTFPVIPAWEGSTKIYVLDETVTAEVLKKFLEDAGNFVGLGRFRPRNNGFYGRFEVVGFELLAA